MLRNSGSCIGPLDVRSRLVLEADAGRFAVAVLARGSREDITLRMLCDLASAASVSLL